jgi:hypothetical protein
MRKKTCKVLMRNLEMNKALGRPRRNWDDNIKIYLKERAWEVTDWSHFVHHRDKWKAFVDTLMNYGFHKRRNLFRS